MHIANLGALVLKESAAETTEGMRACLAYSRDFGKRL